jgi:hypothetical protein
LINAAEVVPLITDPLAYFPFYLYEVLAYGSAVTGLDYEPVKNNKTRNYLPP